MDFTFYYMCEYECWWKRQKNKKEKGKFSIHYAMISAVEKYKVSKGDINSGKGSNLKYVFRERFYFSMMSEQRFEGNREAKHEYIWGQNMASRENNYSKEREEGLSLEKLGTATSLAWLKGTEP